MSPPDLTQGYRDGSALVTVEEDAIADSNVLGLESSAVEESKTDFQGASRSAAPRRRSMMDRVKAMLRVRIDYIKGAWPAELAVLKKGAWWGILWFVLTLVVHNWVHNMAYYYAARYEVYGPYKGPGNPIHDFPFEWLGSGLVDAAVAPGDITNYFSLILGVGYVLRPLFFPFPHRAMNMLWRWGVVASLATYARLVTFMVTLLPGSAQHCAENEFNPPSDWGVILTRLFTSGGCSDLIFSGHMMYTIIVTCGIFRYSSNKYLKIFVLLLTILQAFLIVASRSHYSVDVVPNDFRMTDESISSPGVSDGEDDEEGVEEYPTAVPSSGTGKSSRSSSEHQKVSSVSTRASPGDRDLELGVSPPSGG
ncbi:conserved hypothetical protein [Perkinsus marinus ATCC 50983]|uniref:Sphingomyelin synthase-like domain-containing protein n=1 Tax=Perkinsus marinus (strain ATCC 50983 / TXsc) TaxID=423536 RepID=C5KN46_PERM5|nr:conserved hypothetical protein [Perkinsus marinus ATCC 50983]EER14080.1 conserved hypothetical protein [Perkinsus marinus ATCC 50983]|eukprot:XP_002782285.1 conserved hypothetical protein [Perkinsus marinus ATCC 50983]